MRILRAHSLFAWLSVFSGLTVAAPLQAAGSQPSSAEVTRLEREVERLEASRAVKHLQRAYGFYMDRALYQEASDLFAPDETWPPTAASAVRPVAMCPPSTSVTIWPAPR